MFEEYEPPKTLKGYEELELRICKLAAKDPRTAWLVRRDLCRKDVYYLGRYVSLTRFGKRVLPALDGSGRVERRCPLDMPVAIEVARAVESMGNRTLFIGGRGMLKSTLYVLEIIRQILINPEIKILVVCSKRYLAEHRLRKLMEEIDKNQFLRGLFPDIFWEVAERRRAHIPWSEKRIVVKRKGTFLEGTVDSAGALDSLPIGVHYDRIMGDDMEEPTNVTDATLPKLIDSLEKIPPLLAGMGSVFSTIGTYHHPRGLHALALPEAGWRVIVMPAVDRSVIPDGYVEIDYHGTKKAVFHHEIGGVPRYDTPEYLAEQFLSLKPAAYQTQYWCVKPGEVNRALNPDLIQWYLAPGNTLGPSGTFQYPSLPEGFISESELVLLVDPAHHKSASGDPTAMLVLALWTNGATRMAVVLDGYSSPLLGRSGRLAVAVALIKKWGISQVRWEAFGAVEDHIDLPQRELPKHGIRHVSVVGFFDKTPKNVRIKETLEPLLTGAVLWLPKGCRINAFPEPDPQLGIERCPEMDLGAEIARELEDFPLSPDNHFLDCLAMLSESKAKQGGRRRPMLRWGGPGFKPSRAGMPAARPPAVWSPSTLLC